MEGCCSFLAPKRVSPNGQLWIVGGGAEQGERETERGGTAKETDSWTAMVACKDRLTSDISNDRGVGMKKGRKTDKHLEAFEVAEHPVGKRRGHGDVHTH